MRPRSFGELLKLNQRDWTDADKSKVQELAFKFPEIADLAANEEILLDKYDESLLEQKDWTPNQTNYIHKLEKHKEEKLSPLGLTLSPIQLKLLDKYAGQLAKEEKWTPDQMDHVRLVAKSEQEKTENQKKLLDKYAEQLGKQTEWTPDQIKFIHVLEKSKQALTENQKKLVELYQRPNMAAGLKEEKADRPLDVPEEKSPVLKTHSPFSFPEEKKSDAQQQCETEYGQLVDALDKLGIGTQSALGGDEHNLFYTRLDPLLKRLSPEEASQILPVITSYLVNVFENLEKEDKDTFEEFKEEVRVKKADEKKETVETVVVRVPIQKKQKLRAAANLLDVDTTQFDPFLITDSDAIGIVDIRDIIDSLNQPPFESKSCDEASLMQDEQDTDSTLQRLQKRLYKSHIHVDTDGNVCSRPGEHLVGKINDANRTYRFVSLINGINYKFVCHYLFLMKALEKTPEKFLEEVQKHGPKKTKEHINLLLEQKNSAKTLGLEFPNITKQFTKPFLDRNGIKLLQVLKQQTLCQEILDEKSELNKNKELDTAFLEMLKTKDGFLELQKSISKEQIFFLLLFKFNKKAEEIYAILNERKGEEIALLLEFKKYFSVNVIVNHGPKLLAALKQSTFFAAILEEKSELNANQELDNAFLEMVKTQIGRFELQKYMGADEIFHLLLFKFKKNPEEISEIFKGDTSFPFQHIVAGFAALEFGESKRSEKTYPPTFLKLIKGEKKDDRVKRIWNFLCHNREQFDLSFILNFIRDQKLKSEQVNQYLKLCCPSVPEQLAYFKKLNQGFSQDITLELFKLFIEHKTTPIQAQIAFFIEFAKEKDVAVQKFLAIIHDKFCKTTTAQIQFFQSLSFNEANELLNLFVSHRFPINARELFNECNPLSPLLKTDLLRNYALSTFDIAITPALSPAARIMADYTPVHAEKKEEKTEKDHKEVPEEQLEKELSNFLSAKIRKHVLAELKDYETANLERKEGPQYEAKGKTPAIRAKAYTRLLTSLAPDDCWFKFTRLCKNTNFQTQAGNQPEGFLGKLFKIKPVCPLWPTVESINTRIANQNTFFQKFQDEKLLTRIISSERLYSLLGPEDLDFVFKNCDPKLFFKLLLEHNRFGRDWKSQTILIKIKNKLLKTLQDDDALLIQAISNDHFYQALNTHDFRYIFENCNRALFISLLKKHKRLDNWTPLQIEGSTLDRDAINAMMDESSVAEINSANNLRFKFKIEQNIPDNFILPGRSDAVEDLSPDSLYQYGDADLGAVEYILVRKYSSLLVNKFSSTTGDETKTAPAETKGDRHPPKASFYLVPISSSSAILIDPDDKSNRHYHSFTEFSTRIKRLVDSQEPSKPVIFCGIANENGNHYIPYFIYKNVKNEIQVICVNPSPTKDSKAFLEKAFKKIFKDYSVVTVEDPGVRQQLRERDCGPNSATTIEDALHLASTSAPLLEVVGDKLRIHPNRLTVNFNHKRIFDYDGVHNHYSPVVSDITQANRRKWADQLCTITTQTFIVIDEKGNVDTPCSFFSTEEAYTYKKNVDDQYRGDEAIVRLDGVFSVLLAEEILNEEDEKQKYIKSFVLPKPEEISAMIAKAETNDQVKAAMRKVETPISNIIHGVFERIKRECRADALFNCFKKYLNDFDFKDKPSLDVIVTKFLQKHATDFKELGTKQKDLVERLNKGYQSLYNKRILQSHENAIEEQILRLLNTQPDPGEGKFNLESFVNEITAHFKAKGENGNSLAIVLEATKKPANEIIKPILDKLVREKGDTVFNDLKEYLIGPASLEELSVLTSNGTLPFSLLSDKLHSSVVTSLPDVEVKAENPESKDQTKRVRSLFTRLVADDVDSDLYVIFVERVQQLFLPEYRKALKSKDKWKNITHNDLADILTDEKSARAMGATLGLYDLLEQAKCCPAFCNDAKKDMVEFVRDKAKEILEADKTFSRIFSILLKQSYKLGPKKLDALFAAINSKSNPAGVITSLINDLTQSPFISPQEDADLLKSLSPACVNVFISLHGKEILERLFEYHKSSKELTEDASRAHKFLELLSPWLEESESVERKELSNQLLLIQRTAKALPYFPRTEAKFTLEYFQREWNSIFEKIIRLSVLGYLQGDTNLDGYTANARPMLCSLLEITLPDKDKRKVEITNVIDVSTAQLLDDTIFKKILELDIILPRVRSQSIGNAAEHAASILRGTGTKLKSSRSSGAISEAARRAEQEEKDTSASKRKTPKEDRQPPTSIPSAARPAPATAVTASRDEKDKDKKHKAKTAPVELKTTKPIPFSQLQAVLESYNEEKFHSSSIDSYVPMVKKLLPKAQLTILEKAKAKRLESNCHALFYHRAKSKIPSGIQALSARLAEIQAKHKSKAEFNLTLDDLKDLKCLFNQRCMEKVNPYDMCKHATDRIYILLALIVRDGLNGFKQPGEPPVTANQLLLNSDMIINTATAKIGEQSVHIDDFGLDDIIVFPTTGPNGSKINYWMPKSVFVQNYKDKHGLCDTEDRTPLNKDEVTYILEHYPLVKKELLANYQGENNFEEEAPLHEAYKARLKETEQTEEEDNGFGLGLGLGLTPTRA